MPMSKIAVIATGGKQYLVKPGDLLRVEKLPADGPYTFEKVLLKAEGDKLEIGKPYLEGAAIPAEIQSHGRAKKVISIRFKPKARQRTRRGHRQHFTKVKIGEF